MAFRGPPPQPCSTRKAPAPPSGWPGYVDRLTGFYRVEGDDRPWEVEAYSWGALTSGGGRLQERLKRIGWLSLLPFALVNVGYWSRPGLDRSHRRTPEARSRKATAIAVRWAGLVMTMAFVGTVCWVSVDLLAWQCFRGGTLVCSLPSAVEGRLGFLGTPPYNTGSRRVLIASALPLMVLLLMLLLSNQARGRYEAVHDMPAGRHRSQPTHLDGCQVILRRDRMWQAAPESGASSGCTSQSGCPSS